MKSKSLTRKMLTEFVVCIIVLLALAAPLFYCLTKAFYAEDMIDIIEAVNNGHPLPAIDLGEDIVEGMMIQFGLITLVLAVAIVITLRIIARKLWHPFDETLQQIEHFSLEGNTEPGLPHSDTTEFVRLNNALGALMKNSITRYRAQKEFVENASHELQTPIAVLRSKLDILLQLPGMTEQQAGIIKDLYRVTGRMSHLNKNLLLLAKIENNQYEHTESINITDFLRAQMSLFKDLSMDVTLHEDFSATGPVVRANRSLLESLVNNLTVNAVRHNCPKGEITIKVEDNCLVVANTSDGAALDGTQIFNRFYHPPGHTQGNGLGLAIVKAVCDYHGWEIAYAYKHGMHTFTVTFTAPAR